MLERALADSFALDHPDVPWTPPPRLPSEKELRLGIEILTPQAVEPKHAAWCLAKLTLAFEPGLKISEDEADLRLQVWIEANGDLGNELWSKATLAAIQGLKWMPKPSEFRALVEKDLAERAKRLQRCQAMLAALNDTNTAERPLATRVERLRHSRDTWRRLGKLSRAVAVEEELARVEGRPVEEWARQAPAEAVEGQAPTKAPMPYRELPIDVRAAMLRSQAQTFRAQGFEKLAAYHERQAEALVPRETEAAA